MLMNDLAILAINSALKSKCAYCKFLSANDTGATGGHQCGILISSSAADMLFNNFKKVINETSTLKRTVEISWQGNESIESFFTWYSSKHELRITGMRKAAKRRGIEFDYLNPGRTGSLFVLTQQDYENYSGFFLDTDEEINNFLDAFGLNPVHTNALININNIKPEVAKDAAIQDFINNLDADFPESHVMAKAARDIEDKVHDRADMITKNPDLKIIAWTNMEYEIFRALENNRYGDIVKRGFNDVESFVLLANQVLNRRKSRAGKSFEHHLSAIFDANNLKYDRQAITEGKKRPDFIFPSCASYHDKNFPVEKLVTLAAKTTCKDRWRQILNEADRLRTCNKYLCTLQQGISPEQMDEMQREHVVLIVPEPYIKLYPVDKRDRILTLKKFITRIQELEA